MQSLPRKNNSLIRPSGGQNALYASPNRFSFFGQEHTYEIFGASNLTTALYWEYNKRLGRRWNGNPVEQITLSNYALNRLNAIWFNDHNGDKIKNPIKGIFKGMGNILCRRPWRGRHSKNLAPKVKREPGWAVRIKSIIESSLIHELDVKKLNQITAYAVDQKDIQIPDEPMAHQVEMKTISPLSGGQQYDIFINNLKMVSYLGFAYPSKTVFKVQNSDNLLLSLSSVQSDYGKICGSSGVAQGAENSFREIHIIPSYMFRLKIQLTR